MQEELQQEQTKAAIEVPPSIPLVNSPFVRSSDQAIAHSEAGSVESISPANMEVEEIVRIEMSPSALVIPECIEEAPSLEGSIPVPLVHKKIAGNPSINKEAASTEECPIANDNGETILEPPVQPSEVQDQLPLESTSQLEAEGDPSNTIASELLTVSEPATAMYGAGATTDDLT
ncbi:hypothetical protein MRB53_026020 [Persea americana]|uniref:Uncharacterized protein n=1 Tax=Persea americana TaxID=3435 RepID=A0ACC2LI27_PERAE|nr:hypothetical protein MRB53_026020 [Persea americana]